jgi:hypothetical protein
MLEFCPDGMEKHLLPLLPQTLRTQLGEVEPGDPRAPATREDKLWSLQSIAKSGIVAVAEAAEAAPAIIAESGAVPEGTVERAAGEEVPGVNRGCSQQWPPLPPLQVSPLPTLLLPTTPETLGDSATSTGCMLTRGTRASPPAPGEPRTPGTPQCRHPWLSGSPWWISFQTGLFW